MRNITQPDRRGSTAKKDIKIDFSTLFGFSKPAKISPLSEFERMEVEGPQKSKNTLCVGCGGHIQDQYILRVSPDLEWHASCLKCYECAANLDESCTCFVREGKTYCKRDYVRLFGAKCNKCSQGFSKSDFVMRARNKIFHIDCFRCVACSRQLIPGDEFALRDDGLLCKADNDVVERSMNNNNSPSGENLEESKDSFSSKSLNNDSSKKSGDESIDIKPPMSKGSGSKKEKGHKTTRVRTVLNEKQLHTLRTCYNANPRPDALMKEQLVEMTNLSPRVIRVWFQNKRCKDKKRSIYLKQMQQQQHEKCPSPYLLQQGVPMVASSPVRHEPPPNMLPNPVEVQSYQAPWKALSEFAAMGPGGEMDHGQAPFQQLVSAFGDSPPLPLPPSDDGVDDDDDRVVTLDDSSPMSSGMAGMSPHLGVFHPPPPPTQPHHGHHQNHHRNMHPFHHHLVQQHQQQQHHHQAPPSDNNGTAPSHMIMTDLT